MPSLNEDYQALGYESTSILLNADEMFTTVAMGCVTCVIVFGARALLFTLRSNLKEMEEELENFGTEEGLQRKQTEVVDLNNPTPPKKPSAAKKKVRRWARSKLAIS